MRKLVAAVGAMLPGVDVKDLRPKPAPIVDGQIAAIAFVNGLELVTDNVKDFRRFKGLGVKSWR